MPLVVRTRIAIGCGYGGQHSMDPMGLFALFSGWRIVAPSNAFDYIGLFNSAILCKDPVLIVEHNVLYPVESSVPKNNLDYFVKIGRAKVLKQGESATVLCYSSTVNLVMLAAKDLEAKGISVEVIDLRTVSLADIDYETIGQSLKKTGTLLIVEQTPASMSLGPSIACRCQQRFFDYLDAPIITISALDIPNPVSKKLETAAIPSIDSIKNAIYKAVTQ
jgi:2-oxoisovalerate dehydrogenase E1 component